MNNQNNMLELFSGSARKMIAAVDKNQLSSLEDLIKAQEAADKSHKLHAILTSWATQESEERGLRKLYAICFAVILALQIVFMNIIFLLIGLKLLTITEVKFNIFFVSMFGEIVALVLIVTKYLFHERDNTGIIDTIKKL